MASVSLNRTVFSIVYLILNWIPVRGLAPTEDPYSRNMLQIFPSTAAECERVPAKRPKELMYIFMQHISRA